MKFTEEKIQFAGNIEFARSDDVEEKELKRRGFNRSNLI